VKQAGRRFAPAWLALLLALPAPGFGFAYIAQNGPPPAQPLQNQTAGLPVLRTAGQEEAPLTLNLEADYAASALEAMAAWNAVGTRLQFRQGFAAGEPCNRRDGVNAVGWRASTCDGGQFGDTLAITMISYQERNGRWEITETDILVDQGRAWVPHQAGPLGAGPRDFRRMLTHELGHAFGLEHPDEAGQAVDAIMNSRLSDFDVLQDDDVRGIGFLYGDGANVMDGEGDGGGGGDIGLALLAIACAWWRGGKGRARTGAGQQDSNGRFRP
jgi:hypothetical protein